MSVIRVEGLADCWWMEEDYQDRLFIETCRAYYGMTALSRYVRVLVAHRCGNKKCINPVHLRIDTDVGNRHDDVLLRALMAECYAELVEDEHIKIEYNCFVAYEEDLVRIKARNINVDILMPEIKEVLTELVRRFICIDSMTRSFRVELTEDILQQLLTISHQLEYIPGPSVNWQDSLSKDSLTYSSLMKKSSELKKQERPRLFSLIYSDMLKLQEEKAMSIRI